MSDLKPVKKTILEEAIDNVIEYMVEESDHYDDREEWVDPDKIILQEEESGWVHVNDRLPERGYGSPTSEKVEVYLETGARQLSRYNFEEGLWETELETVEEYNTLDEHVEYWKPLEPDPQIEGRYQTNER